MSTLANAIAKHGPAFIAKLPGPLPESLYQIVNVLQLLPRCRTGGLGGVQYQCDGCGQTHWTGRSCGNRHCATCGHEKSQRWIEKHQKRLLPVQHFFVTFTVPREVGLVLRDHQREGYRCLFDASSQSIRDVGAATKSLKGCKLGYFGVLHTWGRDPMVYHPHVHYIIPGGGVKVDEQGNAIGWQNTPAGFLMRHRTLIRVYKAKLADELRRCGLYHAVPSDVWKKDFVVHIEAVGNGWSSLRYLAPYIHRVAISDKRIVSVNDTSVCYKVTPTKTQQTEVRSVAGVRFVAGFAQHILPSRFQKVRHYGWMSANSSIRLDEIQLLIWMQLGWVYWLASGHAKQPEPLTSHPHCKHCGCRLRVVAVHFDPMLLPRGPPQVDFKKGSC